VENIFRKLSGVKTDEENLVKGKTTVMLVFLYSQETYADSTWYT